MFLSVKNITAVKFMLAAGAYTWRHTCSDHVSYGLVYEMATTTWSKNPAMMRMMKT